MRGSTVRTATLILDQEGRVAAALKGPAPAQTLNDIIAALRTENAAGAARHGSLTAREFAVAVAVAEHEVDRLELQPDSATATISGGTETNSNTGHDCTSGTLVHVKLVGDFHKIPHGSMPNQPYRPTTAVFITADPESGQACLISVGSGVQAPEPGAAVLPVP